MSHEATLSALHPQRKSASASRSPALTASTPTGATPTRPDNLSKNGGDLRGHLQVGGAGRASGGRQQARLARTGMPRAWPVVPASDDDRRRRPRNYRKCPCRIMPRTSRWRSAQARSKQRRSHIDTDHRSANPRTVPRFQLCPRTRLCRPHLFLPGLQAMQDRFPLLFLGAPAYACRPHAAASARRRSWTADPCSWALALDRAPQESCGGKSESYPQREACNRLRAGAPGPPAAGDR